MRSITIILIAFTTSFVGLLNKSIAQVNLSTEKKLAYTNAAYKTLESYIELSELRSAGQSGISKEAAQEFSKLFAEKAMIWDDITPTSIDFTKSQSQPGSLKTVDNYVKDIENTFSTGITVTFKNIAIDLRELESNKVYFNIDRSVSGMHVSGSFLNNSDSEIQMTLVIDDAGKSAVIESIKSVNYNGIKCSNCKSKGTGNGIGLELNLGILLGGATGTANLKSSDMPIESLFSSNMSEPGGGTGFASQVELGLDVFVGKNRNFGFGLNGSFGTYNTSLRIDESKFYYQGLNETFSGNPDGQFVRTAVFRDIEEKLNINTWGIGLDLHYRALKKKVGLYTTLGFTYNLSSALRSKYSVGQRIFEANYQYRDGSFTYSPTSEIQPTDLVISEDQYVSTNSSQDIDSYFDDLRSFNVGYYNQSLEGESERISFGQSINISLEVGALIPISEKINFLAGVHLGYFNMGNNQFDDLYTESQNLDSVYYSSGTAVSNVGLFSFGLDLGIAYKIIK